MSVALEAIIRPSRDIIKAAASLTDNEVRYMVDAYYQMQEYRKASENQIRGIKSAADTGGTHETLDWMLEQVGTMEKQIERALDVYSLAHPVGPWVRSIYGIGPVIAAGLFAQIDITKAPTVGHIWRFAGLDPTGRKPAKGTTWPWNSRLKTLCWKIGQSFMKFSGSAECFYGAIYRSRKEYEIARNESGGNGATAAEILVEKKFGKTTEAYKHLSAGRLPPAQIDARARRYAVKLFLSHLHEVWYEKHFGEAPPKPFAIAIAGHAHYIPPPRISERRRGDS
jgi:hypothetical protein